MTGQRVLVVGAQGFIGRYVVARLLGERGPNAQVLGLGRSPASPDCFTHEVHWGDTAVRAPLPAGLTNALDDPRYCYAALDVRDQPALTELLQRFRPDVIIHLAAALRDDPPRRLIEANVGGVVALLEAIVGAGLADPVVVLGSTGGVYGDPGDRVPIAEDAPCAPVDPYSASKRAAEDIARIIARDRGIRVRWARIFNPVGPGQDERHFCGWLGRQAAAIRAGVKAPMVEVGPLSTTRDFVDVRDVATATVAIADRGQDGLAYNVGSGEETRIERVLEEMLRIAELTDRVRVERRPGRAAGVLRHVADLGRMRGLGYAPAFPLARSLDDVLAYYRDVVAPRVANGATGDADAPPAHSEVRVSIDHRYPVIVEPGLLAHVPQRLRAMFPSARMTLLTDTKVRELYGLELLGNLRAAGIDAGEVVLPEGEASKALAPYERVLGQLREQKFDRRALLVCLGGGLVTDVGGFVAATYLRGVAYANVPTTLIAQHDAAIGGKVAVNMPWAKNFVGAFHHPVAVLSDPCVLRTLDDRNLASGIAESIKVAICGEPKLFALLEREADAIRDRRDANVLDEVVRRSGARKIALLDPDPYEVDLRRALNLGHTFGHPLETELAYASILHGEAVGFGLAVATVIARARGVCKRDDAERILALLDAFGLPPAVPRARLAAACEHLDAVRLVRANRLNFVLPTSISSTRIVAEVEDREFIAAIDEIATHPRLGRCVV